MRKVNHFLRFEVNRDESSLFLCQSKYILDLLQNTRMIHYKSTPTHIAKRPNLHTNNCMPLEGLTLH